MAVFITPAISAFRHDLEQIIFAYLDAARLRNARKDTPLFRTAFKKTGQLTRNAMYAVDVCRMVKRRLKNAGLAGVLSPHSFRVTTITDLLERACPWKTCSAWPATPTRAPPGSTTVGRSGSPRILWSGFRFESRPPFGLMGQVFHSGHVVPRPYFFGISPQGFVGGILRCGRGRDGSGKAEELGRMLIAFFSVLHSTHDVNMLAGVSEDGQLRLPAAGSLVLPARRTKSGEAGAMDQPAAL